MTTIKLKLLIVTLILIALPLTCLAVEEWVGFSRNFESTPIVNLNTSNNQNVNFDAEICGMLSEEKEINGTMYQRLRFPDENKLSLEGYPELPFIRKLIAIPECNTMSLSMTSQQETILHNYNVYPAPQYEEITNPDGTCYMEEVFYKVDSAYAEDALYPSISGEIKSMGYIRDQKYAEVYLYPLRFNPVTQQLTVDILLDIELTLTNPTSDINVNTGIFSNACHSVMLNYPYNGIGASINTGVNRTGIITWDDEIDVTGIITAEVVLMGIM